MDPSTQTTTTSTGGAPVLSKRAMKRQIREERGRELRKMKKLARKEEERNNTALESAAPQQPDWERLPNEPLNAPRQDRKTLLLESFAAAKSRVTIAIDCAFEDKMTESEKKSMAQQIVYAYASNKDAAVPVNLAIVGCQPFLHERLQKMGAMTTWQPWGATVTTQTIETAFDPKKMVYLSADSDNILEELDPDTVYVIGGIVDRNRHKNLCASKAESLGIRTAKFPLDAYFTKAGFSRVLTTNHCVDVLLEFGCSHNWMQACKRGVPIRKLKTRKRKGRQTKEQDGKAEDDEDESGEEGEEEGDEDGADEEGEARQVDMAQGSSTVTASPSLVKPKHAVIFGGASGIGFEITARLFAANWSVLTLDRNEDELRKAIQMIRNIHGEKGELGYAKIDGTHEGDVQRLKSIIFNRFERNVHAFVFNQTSGSSPESELLAKAIPVRELFRIWTGPNRVVPKFIVVQRGGVGSCTQSNEWTLAFSERLPGRVKVVGDADADANVEEKLAEWLNVE